MPDPMGTEPRGIRNPDRMRQGAGYRSVIWRFGKQKPISAKEQNAHSRDARYPRIKPKGRVWERQGGRNFGRVACAEDPPPSGRMDHQRKMRFDLGLGSEPRQEKKTNRNQNQLVREYRRPRDSPKACKARPDTATRALRRENGPSGTRTRTDRMSRAGSSPVASHAPPSSSGASRSPRWRG